MSKGGKEDNNGINERYQQGNGEGGCKGELSAGFERMEFGSKPFQFIISEEKLNEVLTYLLRIRTFGQYAGKSIINNVYMDLDMLCKSRSLSAPVPSWNGKKFTQKCRDIKEN